jgi:hypothetical protein
MILKLITRILIFAFLLTPLAEAIAQHTLAADNSVTRMRRDVSVLAADSLMGREAGTKGEKMASDYISKQMSQIGLLPKGDSGNSFLNIFRMNFPVIFREARLRIDDIEFTYIEEFGATDFSSAGNISSRLINVGKSKSYPPEDIVGNVVLMDIAGSWEKGDNIAMLSSITEMVKSAVDKGAAGIILYNSSRKTVEDVLFGSPFTQEFNVPVVYVARLPFNKIRNVKTAECILTVEVDRTISKPANVIGWIDNKSAKTVVVGAHYDHVGIQKAKGDGSDSKIHNGADDNASGTAVLLELARWAVNNESLRYNYIFAAFSAEEKGLFGSKAFCTFPWVNNDNIQYMLNLDMVGRLGCQGDTISALGLASSPVWETLIDRLEHPDFGIKKISGAPPFSDHAPFLKKEIPVIYFTTGLHPDYHTPKDDTELINFTGMSELVSYIRLFIREAEAVPEIPFHKINPLQNTKAYLQTF